MQAPGGLAAAAWAATRLWAALATVDGNRAMPIRAPSCFTAPLGCITLRDHYIARHVTPARLTLRTAVPVRDQERADLPAAMEIADALPWAAVSDSPPALSVPRFPAWLPSPIQPLVLLLLLGAGALWPLQALRLTTDSAPIDASLRAPWSHLALAPLSSVLDAMSLLSARQHSALLISIFVLYAVSRVIARIPVLRRRRVSLLGEVARAGAFMLLVVGFYAFGVLAPRPMSALTVTDPSLIVVDFHSHTMASHDGRGGFSAERNREWHRDAGFHAAYVSDHGTRSAVIASMALNPPRVGQGMTLLPAIEIRCQGEHLVLLGRGSGRDRRDCSEGPINTHMQESDPGLVALFTMPGNPEKIPGLTPLVGAELVDAAPRAFDEPAHEWDLLKQHAREMDLALVASSNNHGWGRLSAAWSVMRIDGWRTMTPDELDRAIRRTLMERRGGAVTVIERLRPSLGDATFSSLAVTAPALAWHILGTLSGAERVSWMLWTVAAWGLACILASVLRSTLPPRIRDQATTPGSA